jgi:hypothetical protein
MTDIYPDVEGAMKDWLKLQPEIISEIASRVVLRAAADLAFPHIVVGRIGGGDTASNVPVDVCLLQLDVWGEPRDRAGCTSAKLALRSALSRIQSRTLLRPGVYAHGVARVTEDRYLPDPSDNRPRYALTVEVTATATTAV